MVDCPTYTKSIEGGDKLLHLTEADGKRKKINKRTPIAAQGCVLLLSCRPQIKTRTSLYK